MTTKEMKNIVALEFWGRKPLQAWYRDGDGYLEMWDIEYCLGFKKPWAHMSGTGGCIYINHVDSRMWVAPGETVYTFKGIKKVVARKLNPIRLHPKYRGEIWDWCNEGDIYFCEECNDYFPCEHPCKHEVRES